ncbi:DUF3052 domain-containing protein [Muricauda sp. SCSIO 64092]|uniref:DUF3052 domain-containing protein n=1 Tax=Allomuricauda sp. SCSIO 64092 TaxID=2908842 RepID=UPI001FF3EABE|nr:DUF3052 domain-containing protein [Muricauda sp. SCSIO 64092]UOY06621.1 DUF3052 domain-containing protein [Muricauda sp. SCSIO 64092]
MKTGYSVYLKNQPGHYWKLFATLPEGLQKIHTPTEDSIDFIHLFCTTMEALGSNALACKTYLKKTGLLWISWPKGSSSIPTDLKRDGIREYLLKIGLVDVKVAAIDEDWSGLKFVYRTKDR